MSTDRSSPEAEAERENFGDGTPHEKSPTEEKAKRAAQKASAVAKERIGKRGRGGGTRPPTNGGFIANTFGTDNQLFNLLAVVVVALVFYLCIALGAVVMKADPSGVIEYSKPMIALLGSVIAFIAGRGTRQR